ncbi:hypothetical protein [Anthocerotibacter panamensis]|uniref:hypothetical protein n=1 Tax=Anthocerotibacter panamensis TaxID=2857077 RepID=UPI001C404CFC|nr:hypothetical protein [Anthocerotibacter panamensis]
MHLIRLMLVAGLLLLGEGVRADVPASSQSDVVAPTEEQTFLCTRSDLSEYLPAQLYCEQVVMPTACAYYTASSDTDDPLMALWAVPCGTFRTNKASNPPLPLQSKP